MSKKDGAAFSKSFFGYKKSDVNEYIRAADENNSKKIKECEAKINELENTLAEERASGKAEIAKLVEANKLAEKNAEVLKGEYERKYAESEARGAAYLKLTDDANSRAETAEKKISELSSALEEKETEIKDLNDRIKACEKYIEELNSAVTRYAMREEAEKREQSRYIKFRRPAFFKLIKR